MAEYASTCEISNDQMSTDKDEGDNTVAIVHGKEDQKVTNDEQCEAENVVTLTEEESKGRGRMVQYERFRPVTERALSDGSIVIDMQVNMTTQKLTVLRINQLLRRTRKLLATSQETVEKTMETNMSSSEQGNVSM